MNPPTRPVQVMCSGRPEKFVTRTNREDGVNIFELASREHGERLGWCLVMF